MNSFEDLCTDLSVELGRQLNVEEIEFLRWVYGRHMEEMKIENRPEANKFV